jgi:hypothetical protein
MLAHNGNDYEQDCRLQQGMPATIYDSYSQYRNKQLVPFLTTHLMEEEFQSLLIWANGEE